MSDSLRDRIAAVLYRQFPPYQLGYTFGSPTEKWEDESERCRDVYLRDADAVISELDLGIPCAANGCKVRRIARYHAEKSSQLSPEADHE